ncbi:hypothetical protein [Rhodoligotrophos defluvii]|nr:hypothetical protein [Rhodoligotrophos defluvii]
MTDDAQVATTLVIAALDAATQGSKGKPTLLAPRWPGRRLGAAGMK